MNTKEILKEWKKFLNESEDPKFSEKDIGKEVEYEPGPDCKEFGKKRSGKLTGINGNNIKINGQEENTVFIDGKMVPQCYVKLK